MPFSSLDSRIKEIVVVALGVVLPLALYLVLLGLINRRTRPLMVPGTWDFAGLLFGLSGVFIFLGPTLIGMVYDRRELFWDRVSAHPEQGIDWQTFVRTWGLIYLAYFIFVVGFMGALLVDRRRQTAIYNVDPETLAEALTEVLTQEGVAFRQIGDTVEIGARSSVPIEERSPHVVTEDSLKSPNPLGVAVGPRHRVTVEVDASRTLCHVTLKWSHSKNPWREQIERKLSAALDRTESPDSMLSVVFLMVACLLLLVSLCGVVISIAMSLLRG